ncbi:MAG: cupin domain-containing protein [Novosphingobium sp.]|nr:cupin domain-containing protein [Novosphingobium sp.]
MPSLRDSIGLPFTVFRARNAIDYAEAGVMEGAPLSEAAAKASAELVEAGMLEGSQVKLLFARPGLSLTYVWFKSGYPLPRHSHDADCAYFIIAGSLRVGAEELGPGDGFFVGRDVPYTYTPGERGVEVLEIRTADKFDIKMLANNPAYWAKALGTVNEARSRWWHEQPPSGMSVG